MDQKTLHGSNFEPTVVFTTASSVAEAELLARALVEENLAACCTILPSARSVYRWEGVLHADDELLLVIKSSVELFPDMERRIRTLHSYQIPEILQMPVTAASERYLEWMQSNLVPSLSPPEIPRPNDAT